MPPCHSHVRLILAGCLPDISHPFSETSTCALGFTLPFWLLHFYPSPKSLLLFIFLPPHWLQQQSHAFADLEKIFLPIARTQLLRLKSTSSLLSQFCVSSRWQQKNSQRIAKEGFTDHAQTDIIKRHQKATWQYYKGKYLKGNGDWGSKRSACHFAHSWSLTAYMLTQHKARFLKQRGKKSRHPLISLLSAHSWPSLLE